MEGELGRLVDALPALTWSALPDGSADFFNQYFLDYVGFTQEQARGSGWAAAVHPDDLPSLFATWQRILASETLGEAEARLRRADGAYRWFLFRASPLRGESGRVVKWYGVNTDIDDRKRAEDALRQNQAFLADAQRLVQSGSFCWYPATQELTYSEEFSRILGFEPSRALTLSDVAGRVHPEDLPILAEKVALAERGIDDQEYEIRLCMPDGSVKHLRSKSYANRNREGRVEFMGAIQDVTDRHRSEETLSRVRSELSHMTRVASLGALTASIAHEVNQPLAGIITNANTCLRMLASDPPNLKGARETARRTIRDGNRASEVIIRLRAMFAKKAMPAGLVDLNEATREVLALCANELQGARVALRTDLAEELPLVLGDRVQLQQVILNLVLNAVAAMDTVHGRPRKLSLRSELRDDGQVLLHVRDSGRGVAEGHVEQLFEPFFTTKYDGMGVGLSVSRSIVESHHGRLWAEPNDGPGATFSFSVPRAP